MALAPAVPIGIPLCEVLQPSMTATDAANDDMPSARRPVLHESAMTEYSSCLATLVARAAQDQAIAVEILHTPGGGAPTRAAQDVQVRLVFWRSTPSQTCYNRRSCRPHIWKQEETYCSQAPTSKTTPPKQHCNIPASQNRSCGQRRRGASSRAWKHRRGGGRRLQKHRRTHCQGHAQAMHPPEGRVGATRLARALASAAAEADLELQQAKATFGVPLAVQPKRTSKTRLQQPMPDMGTNGGPAAERGARQASSAGTTKTRTLRNTSSRKQ